MYVLQLLQMNMERVNRDLERFEFERERCKEEKA